MIPVLILLFALVVGDIVVGGMMLIVAWLLWRDEVRFILRHGLRSPPSFFEFEGKLTRLQ